MLYNKNLKRVKTDVDCLTCKYWNKQLKKCTGIGKVCFGYDNETKTCIDPITNLPIKF